VTAPTENRLEVGTVKSDDGTRAVKVTSDIAVERVVSLLNEVVAQGALPAL
jgi:hypothetical protein